MGITEVPQLFLYNSPDKAHEINIDDLSENQILKHIKNKIYLIK